MADSTAMDLDLSLEQRISAKRASARDGKRGNNNGRGATGRVSNPAYRKSNRASPYVCDQIRPTGYFY